MLGVLQVLQLLRRERRERARGARAARSPLPLLRHRAAGRASRSTPSRALSYTIDVYRGRAARRPQPARLRALRRVLPAAGRRPDRARRRACCRRSSSRAAFDRRWSRVTRPRADGLGPLQEARHRRQRRRHRQPGLRRRTDPAFELLWAGVFAFAIQIYATSRATPTSRAARRAARLRADEQLRPALPRAQRRPSSGGAGTSRSRPGCATTSTSRSAATAARARRARYCNLMITFAARRPLARRSWNFVLWGALPRPAAGRRARVAARSAARGRHARRHRAAAVARRAAVGGDVRARAHRLADVPRGRRRDAVARPDAGARHLATRRATGRALPVPVAFTLSLPLWAHSLWTVWHGSSYSDRPAIARPRSRRTHDRVAGAGGRRDIRHDPGPAQPHLARLHLFRVLNV